MSIERFRAGPGMIRTGRAGAIEPIGQGADAVARAGRRFDRTDAAEPARACVPSAQSFLQVHLDIGPPAYRYEGRI